MNSDHWVGHPLIFGNGYGYERRLWFCNPSMSVPCHGNDVAGFPRTMFEVQGGQIMNQSDEG